MDHQQLIDQIKGFYITIPTMFRDPDLELDLDATRKVVEYIIENGMQTGNGVILASGAAGDFSTMTFDERVAVTEAVVDQAAGRIPVVMGAQTTSTRELIQLAEAGKRVGAQYIQVSCPYYFPHTEQDFYEYIKAVSEAVDIGIVIYNTFWTSTSLSLDHAQRMIEFDNIVAIKWSSPHIFDLEFERMIMAYHNRLSIIDNQIRYIQSHMMGASAFECHTINYWPQWGLNLLKLMNAKQYPEAQEEINRVVVPFYALWRHIDATHTSGDGYLDKLCMELVGLPSSRCRPPTRDVRDEYRTQARQMLEQCGAPVAPAQ